MSRFFISLLISALVISGIMYLFYYSEHVLSGIVQSAQTDFSNVYLYYESKNVGDYIKGPNNLFIETADLYVQREAAFFLAGKRYEGKRIRVVGNVETDASGRRFIAITNQNQISYK